MRKKKMPSISLSELIRSMTSELRAARASGDDAVIELSECELELSVSAVAEGGGSIKFWLIDAGASVKGEAVSKIRLKFNPVGEQQFVSIGENKKTVSRTEKAPLRSKRSPDGDT